MKTSRILTNGFIIFLGIGLFFMLMEVLGLSRNIYLRLFNFIFVLYGVNRTLQQNYHDGIHGYFTNLGAAMLTSLTSLVLSIFAFTQYANIRGGQEYLEKYADAYLFGGGSPSAYEFGLGLFLEGLAACAIVSFSLMQYWKDRVEKINAVDDSAHNTHNTHTTQHTQHTHHTHNVR
jgi:hypothetical protein